MCMSFTHPHVQAILDAYDCRMRGGEELFDVHDEDDYLAPGHPQADQAVPAEYGLGLAPAGDGARLGLFGEPVHRAPGHRQDPAPPPGEHLKRGTGAWLHAHRSDYIHPGNPVTVLQAAYWIGTMKNANRVTDEVVDRMCAMISRLLLPPGNLFPASYHMVKAVLDVEASSTCARHLCDQCWSLFPHMDPVDYAACADVECTNNSCSNKRFNVSDSGVVVPKRIMYQFDVRGTVLDLMDPIWENIESYMQQRQADFNDKATFWGSPAGLCLDKATGYKFSQPAPHEVAIPFGLGVLSMSL